MPTRRQSRKKRIKSRKRRETWHRRAEGLLHPFLTMGCWNKTYEGSVVSMRDAVLDAITEDTTSNILVIAGDNAYPDKRKVKSLGGTKRSDPIFWSKDIQAGFTKLLNTGKQLWLGIGNHDVDNHIPFNNENSKTVYRREQNAFGSQLPHNYYCIEYDDAALVFIDANRVGASIFNRENPLALWFEQTVQRLEKPYYIVLHEPLIALKIKDKDLRPFALKNGQLLLDIVAEVNHYPIAVLSADIHNYQELDLTYKGHVYRQIVVGTGGASPNVVDRAALEEEFEKNEEGNYKVAAADLEALGFESILYIDDDYLEEPDYGYLRLNSSEEREFIGIGQSEQFLEDGK